MKMIKGNQRTNGLLYRGVKTNNLFGGTNNVYVKRCDDVDATAAASIIGGTTSNVVENDLIVLDNDDSSSSNGGAVSNSGGVVVSTSATCINNKSKAVNNFDPDNNFCNVFINDEQSKLFHLNIKEEEDDEDDIESNRHRHLNNLHHRHQQQLDDNLDNKNNLHSIIGLSNCNDIKQPHARYLLHHHYRHYYSSNGNKNNGNAIRPKTRKNQLRGTYHETLQRIDPSNINHNHYQQHWFSSGLERLKLEDRSRQERLEITRYELRRHLKQILRSDVGKMKYCHSNDNKRRKRQRDINNVSFKYGNGSVSIDNYIDYDDDFYYYYYLNQTNGGSTTLSSSSSSSISSSTLSNTVNNNNNSNNNQSIKSVNGSHNNHHHHHHHHHHHQMFNYDRLVASRECDITKCNRKALPCTIYCLKHIMNNNGQVLFNYCTAKFADNRQCSEPVFDILHELPLCPEHARKRDNYKMYQETKPKKLRKKVKTSAMIRPQKRNKKKKKIVKNCITNNLMTSVIMEHNSNDIPDVQDDSEEFAEDMVEQVLGIDVDHNLITQATHLLEEPDITNVLSTIQVDEFNDFFTVNRNGEYEPTTEETEELERALAAVDNDVKSLEKLSQSHGLLDSLLDEQTLVESLVQIPDMFHNGYVVPSTCGGSAVSGVIGGSVVDNSTHHHHHHMIIGQSKTNTNNGARLLQIEPNTPT